MGAFINRTALITGATRGFGYASALALAQEGAEIIALGRTQGALEELDDAIRAIGGKAILVPLDITDTAGITRLGASIHERWGGLDLWVHSAIQAPPLSPVDHIAEKDLETAISVNIKATQSLITALDPILKAKDGMAIHLDDPQYGKKFFGAYGTTKAAQKALFESWAAERISTGPKVKSYTPDPMPTATRARFFPGEAKDRLSPPKYEAQRFITWLNAETGYPDQA